MDTEKTFKTRFCGRMIEARTLTSGQLAALELAQVKTDYDPEDEAAVAEAEAATRKLGHRFFRIVKSRVSPEEWARIDDGMVDGDVMMEDVTGLLRKIMEATGKASSDTPPPVG